MLRASRNEYAPLRRIPASSIKHASFGLITAKVLWHFRTPDRQWPHMFSPCWIFLVHDVPVCIVLNFKATAVVPVVKNLATQDMTPHPPDGLPPLLCKVLMTHQLLIKIGNLERAVVKVRLADVWGCPLEEQAMMVGEFRPKVEVHEGQNVDVWELWEIEDVRMYEVEV
ncbi:uncharacterized protein N7473_013252 [Penicillium subrubescens]|uniref:uncharacterized protein n=1 Tax=Penicillium subrubescens TaxID=1316194 RepID=UPI002545477C|nr:uncharacterized protein N7473_013252 [Penicillium subrubescens]KAJ5873379.1 hypothetical protein N7473_013252 [Penicillium subrubescens]